MHEIAGTQPEILPTRTRDLSRDGRRWNRVAFWVLPVVAAVGAVLSWGSLYTAAAVALGQHAPTPYGVNLAGAAFPLLVDALILGASARYVAGVKTGRPVAGWRLVAHAGVAGTVLLNADASPTLAALPWHITAPIVWSVLVELVARDVLGQLHEVRHVPGDRIPARLWLTAPAESARVSWHMARTGITDPDTVRTVTERCAAARDQLTTVLPGRAHRRLRRQITRRMWAGALDPAVLTHLIDACPDPAALHRAVLRTVASGSSRPYPEPVPWAGPVPLARPVPLVSTDRSAAEAVDRSTRVAACESGPPRIESAASVPARYPGTRTRASSDRAATSDARRVVTDLTRVLDAVRDGRLDGRITKAKIREHLRCSNPHAGAVNALYQRQTARHHPPAAPDHDQP